MNITQEINKRISDFAHELERLVKEAAVKSVEEALGKPNGKRSNGRTVRVDNAGLVDAMERATRAPREPKKGVRRTTAQLKKTAEALKKHIGEHPGQRMEEIGEAINRSTRVLRRPLNRLLAKQEIVRIGEKRASRYYLPGQAPKTKAKKPRARRVPAKKK